MEEFVNQILAAVSAHKWAEACIALAVFLSFALNTKAEWFPKSLSQGWRVTVATALTIAAAVGDRLLSGTNVVDALVGIAPWLVPAVGILIAEIGYARKGEPVPADIVLPPVPKVSGRRGRRGFAQIGIVFTCATFVALLTTALSLLGCSASFNESAFAGRQARQAEAVRLHLVGASTLTPPAPPSARCIDLDSSRRTWGAVAKTAAVLAGAEGLATIPVHDQTGRVILASGALVVAVVAGVAVYVSEDYGRTWAGEGCGQ